MTTDTIPEDKDGLFKYFDGYEWLYADPFVIDSNFIEATELSQLATFDTWINSGRNPDGSISADATENDFKLQIKGKMGYDPIIRKTFDIKPFDRKTGCGLTVNQVMDLWMDFMAWRNNIKKNT